MNKNSLNYSINNISNTPYKIYKNTENAFEEVDQKLFDFNKQCLPATQTPEEIRIDYIIRENDNMIAGICAEMYIWKILYIEVLFVDELYRKKGLGSLLLKMVERDAIAMGAKLCHLDTYAFQAKDFYLKNGYEIFGILDDCPEGFERFYLKKDLLQAEGIANPAHNSTVEVAESQLEVMLSGGGRTKVARINDNLHRETGTWSDSVHALLKHLEQQEFSGAPRVQGSGYDEQGREVLSYLSGETIHPQLYSAEAMTALGRLLRQMHQCSASFTPPPQADWQAWVCRDIGTPDIIGHGDIAPWNIITQQGLPVAFIDWEFAGPMDRLTEIAYAAWTCAQLYDDDLAEKNALPDAKSRMHLVRLMVDAYGLSSAQRTILVDRLIEVAIRSAAAEVIEQKINIETTIASNPWAIAWRTRSAAWMLRNRLVIQQALQ